MADDDKSKNLFVTVGTTSFDQLIKTICHEDSIQVLKKHGFSEITLQIGKCSFEPEINIDDKLKINFYTYKPSIKDDIDRASLVISHAGAGSVLETLKAKKPLIVVINENLMDNHQFELAERLSQDNHLVYSTCRNLASVLRENEWKNLEPYNPGNPELFGAYLNEYLGFNNLR